jgi:hypothetical protein
MSKKTGINKKAALKMGWDVEALDEFIVDDSTEISTRALYVGDTLETIAIQEGVKYKEKLKDMDVDFTWQDGSGCGWTPDGSVKLSDRELQVYLMKIEVPFCNLDLVETWAQRALKAGQIAQLEDFPFQEAIVKYLADKNAEKMEDQVWNATIAGGDFFNGFESLIAANSGDMIELNTAEATVINSTNAYDVIWAAFKQMNQTPAGKAIIKSGAIIMVTTNQFLDLVKNMVDLNFYSNAEANEAAEAGQIRLHGTKTIVKEFVGRTEDDKFYIANPNNFVFGRDLSSDMTNIDIWYNKDDEEIRTRLRFNAGTQLRFVEEVGYFELSEATLPE